jgi:hypothetical protein
MTRLPTPLKMKIKVRRTIRIPPQFIRLLRFMNHLPKCKNCTNRFTSMVQNGRQQRPTGLLITNRHIAAILRGFHHFNNCPTGCNLPSCVSIRRYIRQYVDHKGQTPACFCQACRIWDLVMRHHYQACKSKRCHLPYSHCHK